MIEVTAFYPDAESGETFKGETLAEIKQDVVATLADPENFTYAVYHGMGDHDPAQSFTAFFAGV